MVSAREAIRTAAKVVSTLRLLPHIAILLLAPENGLVRTDLGRWGEIVFKCRPATRLQELGLFLELMTFAPAYRNVFYLRTGLLGKLLSILCPPLSTLEIAPGQIGPGLFIQHGMATLVSADKIGANCWINQQVTIGFSNDTDRPTIGDNVVLSAGAKVIGKVRIGDNARIGANSVVLSDVPANATVLGVPATVLWKKPGKTASVAPGADARGAPAETQGDA